MIKVSANAAEIHAELGVFATTCGHAVLCRVEDGLSMRATAVKEALEEAGLLVQLTGHLVDCARSTTMTRYYRARRVGGNPAAVGWESQAIHLAPREQLASRTCEIRFAAVRQ